MAQESADKDYEKYFTPEDLKKLEIFEDTLGLLGHLVVNDTMEERRYAACKEFILKLTAALKIKNSFHYPFEQIKTLSVLSPEDKSFRIFTWQLYVNKNDYRYFGAIQMNQEDLKLFPLSDRSFEVEDVEYDILSPKEWYGALYYNIRAFDSPEGKRYLLFGYDGYSFFQKRKLIDVLTFRSDGPVFGAPVFATNAESRNPVTKNRHIMEYSAESSIKLNYDELHEMVLFDHLISMNGIPGQGTTNYPDGSYEGYKFQKGLWVHVDKIFHQVSEEPPREEPILDKRKNKNIFGNQ